MHQRDDAALADAGIAMADVVRGGGPLHGALLLDLNAQEDGACAELSVGYLPRSETVSFVHLESKVPLGAVDETVNYAREGCKQVFGVLDAAIRRRAQETLHSRGVMVS